MQLAVNEIKNGNLNVKKAAERYGINRSTLINHLKKSKCGKVGHPTVLTSNEEELLVHSLIKLGEWGFGLDRRKVRLCVQEFVKRMDRPNPFKDGLPGEDWCRQFENRWRNQLSRRISQNLPKNRADACSAEIIEDFFLKLNETVERLGLQNKPENIYNCDESGFQTDAGQQKILCKRGSRNPHKVVGSTTKATYTILVCCNAIGTYLPLFVNYKGLHLYSN